jgi:formylglycine-generating enzyme required for sulfatase activity/tRNA A-37 threonylcarbamoyl transferase component Bud32
MGVVYIAEHTVIGKRAAVKVLLPEFSKDKVLIGRFVNEAKATTRIRHPGIVEVFDFGHHTDGSWFIVMEFLEGEPLAARLDRVGRISSHVSVKFLQQIAGALATAHAAGITHRDLKPDNIFICPDPDVTGGERAKVLDFGVAKLSGGAGNPSHTVTGAILGTPRYMAPEQCRGANTVDHRADLYALGCIGYAMMCGRPPFLEEGLGDLLVAHMFTEPPRPTSLESSISPPVEAVLLHLLAKDPAERFQNAADVVAALEMAERGQSMTGKIVWAPPAAPPLSAEMPAAVAPTTLSSATGAVYERAPSRRWMVIVPVAIAVLAGVGAAILFTGDEPEAAADVNVVEITLEESLAAQGEPDEPKNLWIEVAPPAKKRVVLGVSAKTAAASEQSGLRPERDVTAPSYAYEIQQHEVTWAELDPWLADHVDAAIHRPEWVPAEPAQREDWPATGVPWETAYTYCQSIGGRLPSEAEWEYAARGPGRNPYAWGRELLDRFRTHAYGGEDAKVVAVMSKDQDRTPGEADRALHDMMGNAQEWVADLWRNDKPGEDESWVQADGASYRVVRGLPPNRPPPAALPIEGAAIRDALCASPACIKGYENLLAHVGFRCARDVTRKK